MNNLLNIGMQSTPTFIFNKHYHKVWEVTYYYEGEGKNITGKDEIFFQKGTIICQPPNIIHEDISENGYKNIYFCVEQMDMPIDYPLVLHDTANGDFLYILKQLYYEFFNRTNHTLITNSLLNVLQQYIILLKNNHSANFYVESFERELVDNLSNPDFKILQAMKKIPLCPDHFRRLFKNEIGKTPQDYLMEIRLNYSIQLLKNSTLSIKNITQMCGFDDPYYFSRLFKKYFGQSPEKWKQSNV